MITIRSGGRDTVQKTNARTWPWNLDDNRKKNSQSVNKSPARTTTTSSVIRTVLRRSENYLRIHFLLYIRTFEECIKCISRKGAEESGELETHLSRFQHPSKLSARHLESASRTVPEHEGAPTRVQHGAKPSREAKTTEASTGPHVGTSGEEQL